MSRVLCFTDTETTGLDDRIHQPWEVCYWRSDRTQPVTMLLPHTLEHADPRSLEINGYFERFDPSLVVSDVGVRALTRDLLNVVIVGSKPEFDTGMLRRVIGFEPWHHRSINISDVAMTVFDWPEPLGMADIRATLVRFGFQIPEPDHTAEGDVRCLRACYEALRQLRSGMTGLPN